MASQFTKTELKDMAYYFDDERLALVKKNKTTGEYDSIQESVTPVSNNYLQIYYHARYNQVSGLEQHINNDIGLSPGLHTAVIYYVKYRLAEDENDLRLAGYYYKKFMIKIKQYPYRKSGTRGIKPFGL